MSHDLDDMGEKPDEAANLTPPPRTARPTDLRSIVAFIRDLWHTRREEDPSTAKLLATIAEEDEDNLEDVDLSQPLPTLRSRLPGLRSSFVPSVRALALILVAFTVGLGVGCGLGLGIPYYDSLLGLFDEPDLLSSSSSSSSSYNEYGVPDELPVIPIAQLINERELSLNMGFRISRTPTVREFEFNISHGLAAPDGFYKPMILANGQSPGPLIEANTGDTVRVRVNNLMPNTTTGIHFHGINQYRSPWMDGVVGVTQCGIPAGGGSWTYEFVVAGQRGTFWWHAHAGVQFTDGLFGPIVIHDPDEAVPETDDDKILFLGENYHSFAAELAAYYLAPSSTWDPNEAGVEPLSDNLVLNGQNTHDCSITSTTFTAPTYDQESTTEPPCNGGQAYTTSIQPGSTLRLRLINHSSYFSYWFSIDAHELTIVEIDGVEVDPITSLGGVHVNIGQRYSVIVNGSRKRTGTKYTIRSSLERACFLPYGTYTSSGLESIGYEARGVLRYEEPDAGAAPTKREEEVEEDDDYDDEEEDGQEQGQGQVSELNDKASADTTTTTTTTTTTNNNPWGCNDLPFDIPIPMRPEPAYALSTASSQFSLDFQFRQVGTINRIFLNRTSWAPYGDDATLWQALEQDFVPGDGGAYNNWGFRLDQQVLLVPDEDEAVGTVQVAVNSLDAMEHPFHMHGHTVQIVGWGPGRYAGPTSPATTWNLENPMRRDTFTVPEQSHVVIRFRADNPGMWILHCHVAWHLEAGMAASFLEQPNALKALAYDMDPDTRALAQSFCAGRQ